MFEWQQEFDGSLNMPPIDEQRCARTAFKGLVDNALKQHSGRLMPAEIVRQAGWENVVRLELAHDDYPLYHGVDVIGQRRAARSCIVVREGDLAGGGTASIYLDNPVGVIRSDIEFMGEKLGAAAEAEMRSNKQLERDMGFDGLPVPLSEIQGLSTFIYSGRIVAS